MSGLFSIEAAGSVEVFAWDHHNRLQSVDRYSADGEGPSTPLTMPGGESVSWEKNFRKEFAYDVHDQLIGEEAGDVNGGRKRGT